MSDQERKQRFEHVGLRLIPEEDPAIHKEGEIARLKRDSEVLARLVRNYGGDDRE